MRFILGVITISSIVVLSSASQDSKWSQDTGVYEVLFDLGEEKPEHYSTNHSAELIERGKELIYTGKSTEPNGNSGGYISKFYACVSCHNTVREDPDLTKVDQDARLEYAKSNNIPYLQGSTFWGMVNRESWYNDDYVLKYGDLVLKANKSLKESIQLCATVCSQGRAVKDWEMDAILAYLWSLEMTLGDLNLSNEEWKKLNSDSQSDIRKMLKSKYMLKSPATFLEPPEDKMIGYNLKGRPEKGEDIFNLGCRHCHRPNGESDVVFDDSKATYRYLNKHKLDNTSLSIYEIIRRGTYSELGHKEYMPHYTKEKMSNQQVEDLRSFIEQKVGK